MNQGTDNPESETGDPSLEPGVVCTACLEVNPPHVNYCAKCGALLNSLAAFNPFDQTLIEGFAYRRAVDGPPSRIILVGIWLLFAPYVFLFPLIMMLDPAPASGSPSPATLLLSPSHILVSVVILYRTTFNYFARRQTTEAEAPQAHG